MIFFLLFSLNLQSQYNYNDNFLKKTSYVFTEIPVSTLRSLNPIVSIHAICRIITEHCGATLDG